MRKEGAKLRHRDWVVLPLLAAVTVLMLVGVMELLARWLFPEAGTLFAGACMVVKSKASGLEGIPSSVCREKAAEGPLVEYRFNTCGHRAGMECGPKAAGTYRIVMTGSSYGFGYAVPWESTFAALLPKELADRTGRTVELYNVSMAGRFPQQADTLFHEVLAAKPDMILWELAPADVEETGALFGNKDALKVGNAGDGRLGSWSRTKSEHYEEIILKVAPAFWKHALGWHDHIALLLQHFLYESESQDQYVDSYLRNGDQSAGFLKADLSPSWQEHLRQFDRYAADMEAQATAAGIPFTAVLVPNRAQATMLATGRWPNDYDPYKLDHKLRAVIESHGGIYLDILPGFKNVSHVEGLYFTVDGHPKAAGHAVISALIAQAMQTTPSVASATDSGQQRVIRQID